MEHDKPTLLFQMACEYLHQNKIVRIGTTRLEKLVSTARQQAQEFCYQSLQPLLTEQCRQFLDGLLEVDIGLGRTKLSWLQRTPTSNNTTQILETLDKIAFLQQCGIEQWDFGQLNPNRTNYLAGIGAKSSNQYLQRTNESRRYPILAAFLKRSLYNFIDDLIEMVDKRLLDLHSEARRTFETERLQATRTINQKLKTLQDIGSILLNQNIADHNIRTTTFAHISPEQLKNALVEVEQLIRPENDAYVDYFCKFYNRVRKFSSRLLSTLEFQTQGNDHGLLRALEIVREIHAGERRKLPASAPIDFIPANWHDYIFESEGVNWRHYELAALRVLRLQIRSGDIYVSHSRRFSPLEAYLISNHEWQAKCSEAVNLMGVSIDAAIRLKERECELVSLIAQVDTLLNDAGGGLREERSKLILTPFEAEPRSAQLNQLTSTITVRLPRLDLTDLLVEVDNWTHFSATLEHLHTPQQRDSKLLLHLYTCLLTQACNLEFEQMASATGLTARNLSWHNTWYIRDDTLRSANNALVNYHYHLPLSHIWGSGMLSSSDGQRFPAKGSLRQARSLPRYFGYGKGITFYSWASDQFSQYGSKPIPATVRDATYVLDEILNNETELPILEHTTDTAGYTELIFALFDLLGLRFSPRIRDLGDQQLYRTHDIDLGDFPKLKSHLQGIVHKQRIIEGWDEMLRLAGSLKLGWVTASLIVQKLQAFPRKHPLMRLLPIY